VSNDRLSDEEWLAYRWKKNMLGGFEHSLMDTISRADENNLELLSKGFPIHVSAYKKFTRERGWWQSIEQKMKN